MNDATGQVLPDPSGDPVQMKQWLGEIFQSGAGIQLELTDYIRNLVLAALLSYILGLVYVRYGTSLSNRRSLAGNFLLLTVTTMVVISIVKSSLALSLGLVGALSIVRFRAAIKEPEELTYLFLSIGIGLGLGADLMVHTLVAFAFIVLIIWVRSWRRNPQQEQNLHISIHSSGPEKISLQSIIDTLKAHCRMVDMKRFDEEKDTLEATFLVEVDGVEQLNRSREALHGLNDNIRISFLDVKGLA